MINFKEFILEGVTDIPRDTLDPTVFSFPTDGQPKLQSAIKKQILSDITKIDSVLPVKQFYIIGSILTKRYNKNSDIDINVEIENRGASDEEYSSLISRVVKKLNGKLATGTTHPINYYIMREEYDLDKTDAAYDVLNNRWLKIAKEEEDIDIKKYLEYFQRAITKMDMLTGELRRDIIDLEYYKTLPTAKIKKLKTLIDEKLREIEDDIVNLGNSKKEFKDLREFAFKKNLSFTELREYISRNWLPENVSYKLFTKYHYDKYVSKLNDFLEGNKPLQPEDVDELKQIGKSVW